jgi:hypothetical protein
MMLESPLNNYLLLKSNPQFHLKSLSFLALTFMKFPNGRYFMPTSPHSSPGLQKRQNGGAAAFAAHVAVGRGIKGLAAALLCCVAIYKEPQKEIVLNINRSIRMVNR